MLSSVLRSKQAIQDNIQVMLVFSKIKEILLDTLSIKLDIEEIKNQLLQLKPPQIQERDPLKADEQSCPRYYEEPGTPKAHRVFFIYKQNLSLF